MRNPVEFLIWNSKYLLQELSEECLLITIRRSERAAISCIADELVEVRLAKNRMQSCHHRHFEAPQQTQDVAAGLPAKNPILMLQTH